MTSEEAINVQSIIEDEGLDYTFMSYSRFEQIKDEKFHAMRQAYVDAANALEGYVESQT